VQLTKEPSWARTNWQSYIIRVARERQRAVMQQLLDEGISTRRGAMNAHMEGAYPPDTWRSAGSLACSEDAQQRGIVLPLFHQLSESDQDRVIDRVRHICGSQS
jgi:dTDP-4-amino-4,6-dideoxygalactose transaminase